MNKIIKFIKYIFLSLVSIIVLLSIYVILSGRVSDPEIENKSVLSLEVDTISENLLTINKNWLHKNNYGLYEMYVEGSPFERGVINGKLAKSLIHEQEAAFSDQIEKLVPSSFYRRFLTYLIGWYNRDLEDHVAEENKIEIFGVSRSASHDFDYVGPAYQRMLNYHAAHDIGHALQNLALVGCTSFATWGSKSEDNKLIVGRNFDFYVGDRFSENKIIQFVNPDKGYKFMMITWGGMTGVVSGMNMQGLTITLNAAKSDIPSGSATPVSLLAREILQYASNISEAIEIAASRKVFVSESFLIGSAQDNKAVSIELTPDKIDVYESNSNQIICTNHFESAELGNTELNKTHMQESASLYRYKRVQQLLDTVKENNAQTTASILRDQKGLNDKNIGMGNEKAINQLICHHSIIFEPNNLTFWISTDPWQLGSYIAYHMSDIFKTQGLMRDTILYDSLLTIRPDPFLITKEFENFVEFRIEKNNIVNGEKVNINNFVQLNPEYYNTYIVAGDYSFSNKNYESAASYYSDALTKEIATETEKNAIIKKLNNEHFNKK